jgi:hypothetical protein
MPTKGPFRSIVPAGIGKAGHIAKHTAPYGMGSEPRSFFFPSLVVPLQVRARRTSSPLRTCLVPSLDRGDASARDGSRSGRRDP